MAALATVSGALTFVAVSLVAVAARRPVTRRPPPAHPDTSASRRTARRIVALVTGGVGVTVLAMAGPAPLVIASLTVGGIAVRRRRVAAADRRRRIEAAVPDAMELLVLCVHAGRSPTQAVMELGRRAPPVLQPAFAAVDLQLHRGRTLADALGLLPRVIGPAGQELAAAVAAADRDGLPLAPVLDRLAGEARAARRRLGDAAARRLPVRLSFPLVVCTLPSFVLLTIAPAVLGALSTLRGSAP